MNRQRIQVYTDSDIKRRIELAAAKHDMPVTEYCLAAIQQQLIDDDLFERNQVLISIRPTLSDEVIASLQGLREQILARREVKLFDLDDALDQTREERDYELLSMC